MDSNSQQPAGLVPVIHARQKGTRLAADDKDAKGQLLERGFCPPIGGTFQSSQQSIAQRASTQRTSLDSLDARRCWPDAQSGCWLKAGDACPMVAANEAHQAAPTARNSGGLDDCWPGQARRGDGWCGGLAERQSARAASQSPDPPSNVTILTQACAHRSLRPFEHQRRSMRSITAATARELAGKAGRWGAGESVLMCNP